MRLFRRYRVPLLIVFLVILAGLFFGDYLTGYVQREYQDPYSREKRIVTTRFGVTSERVLSNPMSELFYGQLKQPKVYRWEPSGNSYTVQQVSGSVRYDENPVPPVMFLEPETELAFLRALPNDAARLAVILSLYQPRKAVKNPQTAEENHRQSERETERVRRIIAWYNLDRHDYSVGFPQWWRDNAHIFGIQPDGMPLSANAKQGTRP